jgi:hypothetical protein
MCLPGLESCPASASRRSSSHPQASRLSFLRWSALLLCLTFFLPLADAAQQAGTVIPVANGDVAGLISAIQTLDQNGGGTIMLAVGGQYTVSQPSDWWYGPNAFPAITSNILIVGSGSTIARAPGSPKFRFFYVAGGWEANMPQGTLTLTDLTLTNGLAQGGNGGSGAGSGGGGAGLGGAIYNQGQLNLARVHFVGNTAVGGSGGCCGAGVGSGGGGGLGGDGGSIVSFAYGAGGGGFKGNGQNSTAVGSISPSYGGSFLGNEGGAGGSVCSGGTSVYGGNGGGSGTFANGGGGGGGFQVGQNGGTDTVNAGPGGAGAFGGGTGGNGVPYWNGACSGGGGAFGGGGGGAGMGGGGGGGVGGGGGGGGANNAQGGGGGFGGGGGGIGGQGGFGGGGGNGGSGGFGGASSTNGTAGGGAGMGGAVFNHGGQVLIGNVTFLQNSATAGGNGAQGLGGGIFNLDGKVELWNAGASPFGTATGASDVYNLADIAGTYQPGQVPTAAVSFVDVPSSTYSVANIQNAGTAAVNSNVAAVEFTLKGLQTGPGGAANGLSFGNVALNQTHSQTFTVNNTGQTVGAISSVQVIGSNAYSVTDNCNGAVVGCSVTVSFNPGAEGAANAALLIADAAPDSPQVVYLSGTGGFPSVGINPSSVSMSAVFSQSTTQRVVVTNTGSTDPLTISSVQLTGDATFGESDNCTAAAIGPGSSCTINITWQAAAFPGANAAVTLTDNAASLTQVIPLAGQTLKADQVISVTNAAPASALAGTSFPVAATASSGLPVNIAGTGACSGGGTGLATVTMNSGTGSCTVTFSEPGNSVYNAAAPVVETVAALPDPVQQNFGSVNVCPRGQTAPAPCSGTVAVSFTMTATTTLGAIQAVTQGTEGLDFSVASGSTCTGTVAAGNSCTVNVTFAPIGAGLRQGAVLLYDSQGNLVTSALVYGIGQEPVIAFGPGTQSVVNTGSYPLNTPNGAVVDAAGNLYIADTGNARVLKVAPNGAVTTVGFGLQYPQGLAVDGAGDVFIADNNRNQVLEVPAGCASAACQQVVSNGLRAQLGVAVDGAGNVFYDDFLDGEVVKIPANGGAQTVVYSPGAGSNPVGLSVDSAGDLLIADFGLRQVVKVTPGGAQSTVGVGWVEPESASADAAGNIYVADAGLQSLIEVPVGCNASACQITLASGIATFGATVDAAGNAYISVRSPSEVIELKRSVPPSLSFATTNAGSTSSDSPQTVWVQNTGNQALTGSLNFSLGANFQQGSTCDNLFPLNPGAVCYENFSFVPQTTGYFEGSAVFSDNALNLLPAATQTISLVGNGGQGGQPGAVTVPNVVGQVQADAQTTLTGAGLAAGTISTAASPTVPAGSVIDQNPSAGTQVTVGAAVKLLVSSGQPHAPTPNPLSLLNNYFVTGDFTSAGVTLRGTGQGGVATGTINLPNRSQSSQGVPDGADILAAYLYWETLENTASASGGSGTFRGYSIMGQQVGNDLPYTDGALNGTLRVYRANVNAFFPADANGIRHASGANAVSLPDSGGSGFPVAEGASLVVIYRVMSPQFPLKSVVIYDGAAIPPVSTTQTMQGFYDAVGGAAGSGELASVYAAAGNWNNDASTVILGQASQYDAPLNAGNAYAALILSTPVNNSDNDGILDAWKAGPGADDFHAGQPGYYDAKTGSWVALPGARRGQKDLFVQLDYECGALLPDGSCDPTQENTFPAPDAQGHDPLAMVTQAFAAHRVHLHLDIVNAVPEDSCTDNLTTTPPQLCQFPGQKGVISWKNSLMFSKLWPKNLASCATGGDCTTRFAYGRKDSYHYVLFGHSLAIPAWNSRFGSLTSIQVANGTTTIVTADRGNGINACPSRITLSGVLGNPTLNGVYNTSSCPDTKTIIVSTPGVPNWSYPNNTLPEPVIGLTSGTISSISGYSDLGGADSAITLGLWATAPNQDMSKRANVTAGTLFHEIGHTLGLSHGGLYYDTPGSYAPTFEANCKPNYQSVMNYLFQLDLVGPNKTLDFSNQTLNTLNESQAGSVTQMVDGGNNAATFATSAWYVPYTTGATASPATRHCDGTPLNGDSAYRVDASIAPITPAWTNGQDINFDGQLNAQMRGYNDWANIDLRQVGATGGQFASLASVLTFGSSSSPLNVAAGGNVTLGSGGTVTLGSGGTVTLGSGGNVTLGSGGTITLGSGGNVTLGSGGNVTLGSGGTITLGSGGNVVLGSGGNVTLGSGGTITLGSGGNVVLGSGGTVTLGSGGTIALGSGGVVTIPATGGTYTIDGAGGTITLGSGGNVTLGSGGNVTLGSGGTIALGSGGNITLGSGGNVTLGSGGTIALGSGGTVTLGSGGNVTLGSGGTIALGSGGTVTLGSGGNVTLGSGGTVTLGSGGDVSVGSGGNVTLGSGGTVTLGSGGTVTLGSGGNVTLGSGGNVTLGSGGTITLGSGGNVTLGSGGNFVLGSSGGTITLGSGGNVVLGSGGTVTLGSGGTITLGSGGTVTVPPGGSYDLPASGGTITLGSGGNVTLGSGGNVTLGSGGTIALGSGGNITLGSGGNVTLGSGGTITLGSGGNITLGSGGTVTLGSGGNVTLGSGGVVALGSGGNVTLGSGGNVTLGSGGNITLGSGGVTTTEMTYDIANSVVRPPELPTETPTPVGVRVDWTAPAFGVVQTYTIYRSSDGGTPVAIGSVSGVNGNPPATTFFDTNPDLTSKTVVYTISTTVVPDATDPAPRQSPPSAPAVLKNDQSITLGALPSSVVITDPQPTVTATATTSGVPNGLQVSFTATGSCAIGSQSIASGVSSATVTLNSTGSCTITAAQAGTDLFNAANAVSGTFMILPQGSQLKSQTINFGPLADVQYGSTFALSASSSSGLPVSFAASGPCTTSGTVTGVGLCTITASAAANSTYTAASVAQSFTVIPAVLKVTANNVSSVYGQPLPNLTYTYSGFVNGEPASVVNGTPALTTTATSSSNAGSYPITVSTGTLAAANYSFLYVSGTLTIQQASQAITFTTAAPGSATYGSSFTVAATGGNSGNAVTFSSGGSCSNVGAVYTMTSGAGACSVIANQAGNTNYTAAAQVIETVNALPAAQTITFTANAPATADYKSSFTVAANGGASGNPVIFSSAGPCSNSGATYTMTNSTGTCSVIANQAGNTNYAAAAQVVETVKATGPLLTLSSSSIDFGTVYLGGITRKDLVITNGGTQPVTITDPRIILLKGGNASAFVVLNLCPKSLAVGSSCTMAVTFVAGPVYTPQSATLQIVDNAPGSPQAVTLTAQVIHPLAVFSPDELEFEAVKLGTSKTVNVTLRNPGATPLIFSGAGITLAGAADFTQSNNCGSPVAAGGSCTIAVTFTPHAKGPFSANLTVTDNAQAGGGTQVVPISGKGNGGAGSEAKAGNGHDQ